MQQLVLARLGQAGATYPYDLGGALAELVDIDRNSVYTALDRLSRTGLVESIGETTRTVGRRRETVQLYDVTEAGRARIRAWMRSEPSGPPTECELIQRLLLSTRDDLPNVLAAAQRSLRTWTEHLSAPRPRRVAAKVDADLGGTAVLLASEFHTEIVQANLRWLRKFIAVVERLIATEPT